MTEQGFKNFVALGASPARARAAEVAADEAITTQTPGRETAGKNKKGKAPQNTSFQNSDCETGVARESFEATGKIGPRRENGNEGFLSANCANLR